MRRRHIGYAAALWKHFGIRLTDIGGLTVEELAAMTRAIDDDRMATAAAVAAAKARR